MMPSITERITLNHTYDPTGYFLQRQTIASNMCGLCCLNNMYQRLAFTKTTLDNIADALWYRHWQEFKIDPIESVQPMRSQIGDYSIDVLLGAINSMGHSTKTLINPSSTRFYEPKLHWGIPCNE